jgi:methionyl-tRNA synthetase
MRNIKWSKSSISAKRGFIKSGLFKNSNIKKFCSSITLENSKNKKVYITTPIFYVNSKPHIGHLYSTILASAVKQVKILSSNLENKSNNTYLTTGTDEHGLKVQQKARDEKIDTYLFCHNNSQVFKNLFDKSKIDYDYFIRTSDESHKNYVSQFWNKLLEKGKINKTDYSGFYSIQEESFIPEKDLIKKGDKYYTSLSSHSNQAVEYITEKNYQLKFSKEDIEKYLKLVENEKLNFYPKSIINEVKGYISQNLMDLCISRPSKRVSWGIDVPNDKEHVIYVWFEALLNYLTIVQEINKKLQPDCQANPIPEEIEFIHIIGKDISKFHCYLWPLILLLNKSFPFKMTILMHNYWLKNDTKMSKSIGNVIDPEKIINKFGIDAVRFYFLAAGPLLHDVSFDEKTLTNVFYRNIPDTFINLILRLTNNKIIDINNYNKIEKFSEENQIKIKENLVHVNNAICELNNFNFIQAAHQIHLILLNLNNLIQTSEFWKKTEDIEYIKEIACFSFEFIRIISILFYPYLPELMGYVNKYIGVDDKFIKFKYCFFRGINIDIYSKNPELREFNSIIKNGYFKVDLSYKNKIFVNKIKI